MKGVSEMFGFSAGDLLFIALIGGLIWGLLLLAKRARREKKDKDTSASS